MILSLFLFLRNVAGSLDGLFSCQKGSADPKRYWIGLVHSQHRGQFFNSKWIIWCIYFKRCVSVEVKASSVILQMYLCIDLPKKSLFECCSLPQSSSVYKTFRIFYTSSFNSFVWKIKHFLHRYLLLHTVFWWWLSKPIFVQTNGIFHHWSIQHAFNFRRAMETKWNYETKN